MEDIMSCLGPGERQAHRLVFNLSLVHAEPVVCACSGASQSAGLSIVFVGIRTPFGCSRIPGLLEDYYLLMFECISLRIGISRQLLSSLWVVRAPFVVRAVACRAEYRAVAAS